MTSETGTRSGEPSRGVSSCALYEIRDLAQYTVPEMKEIYVKTSAIRGTQM